MRQAYVCTVYTGERRIDDVYYRNDIYDYVKWQIHKLSTLKHNINTIFFVINKSTIEFDKSIFPSKLGDAEVVVYERKNIGLSYGAFSHVVSKHINDYEYFFFNEDDYVPVIDFFFEEFITRMHGCDYVCCLYEREHAAMSGGVFTQNILRRIIESEGQLSHSNCSSYSSNEVLGQIGQSRSIIHAGGKITDVSKDFILPFVGPNGTIHYFGNLSGKKIMSPVMLERTI